MFRSNGNTVTNRHPKQDDNSLALKHEIEETVQRLYALSSAYGEERVIKVIGGDIKNKADQLKNRPITVAQLQNLNDKLDLFVESLDLKKLAIVIGYN